ncbi:hypothetical protein [Synechococcus sp. CBW1107]|uniref:hypothetical protein n=1 Tax=Synechococcus sp. CBW1107 TaxID=2789857 RepID=UPI002AD20099|nr:hypothetical protein [Synechococcus sp. CBW1107]
MSHPSSGKVVVEPKVVSFAWGAISAWQEREAWPLGPPIAPVGLINAKAGIDLDHGLLKGAAVTLKGAGVARSFWHVALEITWRIACGTIVGLLIEQLSTEAAKGA